MRRIGDNEAITISWRKFKPDLMRKIDEEVQDDGHLITSFAINHNTSPFSETRIKNTERLLKI
jgi:hypothetical protein